jgi:hypothetical protein
VRRDDEAPVGNDGAESVASAASLRRAVWIAAVYGVSAGVAYGAATQWRRGFILTLAAAVSIVALRSLEGVVRHLRVDADGLRGVSAAPDGLGWRYPLRIFLLTVLILVVALGGHDPLGLILGLSAVPLAIIVEAAVQLVAISRTR